MHTRRPRLDVGVGLNVFCSTTTTGRFTVHDIDVTNAPQPDPSAGYTR